MNSHLSSPATAAEWLDVLDEGDVLSGIDAYTVASWIERWRQTAREARGGQTGLAINLRWVWALSLLLANEADGDSQVRGFRRAHLPHGLVDLDEVHRWVETRSAAKPTIYGTGEVPRRDMPDVRRGRPIAVVVGDVHWKTVKYPLDGWVGERSTTRGTPLDELRLLTERLADTYPWQPAQATAFVLSGATPVAQVLTTGSPSPAKSRATVTITADLDLPVEAVAAAYLRARVAAKGAKPRLPSAKGVELVIHAEERPGASVHALRQSWNREHADDLDDAGRSYQYGGDDIAPFRQALRDARRRIRGTTQLNSIEAFDAAIRGSSGE